MLYWEEEIAAYRTTRKGFACGMHQTAFQIELKGVINEINMTRNIVASTNSDEEVKRTGKFMTFQILEFKNWKGY